MAFINSRSFRSSDILRKVNPMNYLLLISCSERKVLAPELLPALDRYDGPAYRTLRKFRSDGGEELKNLSIRIISAKHGLIHSHKPIRLYNQLMTPRRAEELRPHIQAELRSLINDSKAYDQVFINLGRTYMRTLEGFHWGSVTTLEASGGIGLKTQQMKAWLKRIER